MHQTSMQTQKQSKFSDTTTNRTASTEVFSPYQSKDTPISPPNMNVPSSDQSKNTHDQPENYAWMFEWAEDASGNDELL